MSSYYKFMAVGEANADQPRIYEMKREHPYRTERRTRENIERRKGKCSGVKPIIDKIAFIPPISRKRSLM